MKNDLDYAYEYINKVFSEEEVKTILSNGDDIAKSAVLLNIENIKSKEIADLIINNLTHQSGPVREACAFKLSEIIGNHKDYFQDKKCLDTILYSLTDVNPNVVRFMLNTLKYIEDKDYIFNKLVQKINELYNEIPQKPLRGKEQEHIITKKYFKIYWCLESIKKIFFEKSDIISFDNSRKNDFNRLLKKLYTTEEYTIREKIAQIVGMLSGNEFNEIKMELVKDKNYFVRRHGKDS